MQKIMLNDRYGLTRVVLEGRKTMTRRIAEKNLVEDMDDELCWDGEFKKPKYKVGEVVAVAQAYRDIRDIISDVHDEKSIKFMPGWSNKMFVRADLMPHQIRITNVHVERLQDISDEDCLREGIVKDDSKMYFNGYAFDYSLDQHGNMLASRWYKTSREAFAALIDKVSGKGTWASNPWVYVYEFELVRRMRQAQKNYFRTRHKSYLDYSRDLEKQVDAALEEYEPNLFET